MPDAAPRYANAGIRNYLNVSVLYVQYCRTALDLALLMQCDSLIARSCPNVAFIPYQPEHGKKYICIRVTNPVRRSSAPIRARSGQQHAYMLFALCNFDSATRCVAPALVLLTMSALGEVPS